MRRHCRVSMVGFTVGTTIVAGRHAIWGYVGGHCNGIVYIAIRTSAIVCVEAVVVEASQWQTEIVLGGDGFDVQLFGAYLSTIE